MANNWVQRSAPSIQLLPGKSGTFANRRWGSMRYDPTRKKHWLWEGYVDGTYLDIIYSNSLYTYDYASNKITQVKLHNWAKNTGSGLTEPLAANSTDPTPCDRHPNFCVAGNELHAFGGLNSAVQGFTNPLFDTWKYSIDSNAWTLGSPTTKPSQGIESLLVCIEYSRRYDRILVGSAPAGASTRYWWLKNPSTGEYEQLEVGPSGRGANPLAEDTARGLIWLFGGGTYAAGGNELWRFDVARKRWAQIPYTGATPQTRSWHGFAYDSKHDVFLIQGGADDDESTTKLTDTFLYDPKTNVMTQLSPVTTPTASKFSYLTYDAQFDQFVLFNDSDQVWTYQYDPGHAHSAIRFTSAGSI